MELTKKILISKILLTLGALEFFGPILRDTNSSHLLNPEWVGHARFHLMWCISLWGTMGAFSLILLWRKPIINTQPLYLVMALQLLNTVAFWSSTMLSGLYDGDIFDAKIHVGVMNINENISVFITLSLFLLFNYWYVKYKIEPLTPDSIESDLIERPIQKTDVLITGGGPSGMIAAIYLSKLGIPNILIERRQEIQSHPKAHELSARSIEILSSLGIPIAKLVKEASDHETASNILFCNTINDVIGQINLQDRNIKYKYDQHLASSIPYLNISQTEFEKILRDHLKSLKLTTVLLNHKWISCIEKENVESIILNRELGKEIIIKSKYLISADGARSSVREQLGIKMNGPEKIQDVVNAYFTNDMTKIVKNKAKLYWIFNPEAPGVFIAHHPKKRWVYHHAVETQYQKIEDFDEAYFQKKMKIAMGLSDDFKFNIESISSWRMTAQIAETFRKGKIFLIGDAAHRFPPTGGLGMNSGIGDAQNLCWKLASVIRGEASPTLLDTYQSERKPILQKNCDESRKNWFKILDVPKALGLNPMFGQFMDRFFHSFIVSWLPKSLIESIDSSFRKAATNLLLKNKSNPQKIPLVKKAIENQIAHFDRIGLDLGYRYQSQNDTKQKASTVSEYFPSIENGNRFPHFWLDKNRTKSSHSLLSPTHFTLITTSESKLKKFWQVLSKDLVNKLPFDIQLIKNDVIQKDSFLKSLLDIDESGVILIRPDGHVAWKTNETENETNLKNHFLEMTSSFLNPNLSKQSNYNMSQNQKGRIKMFVFSLLILIPILFFSYYLFRPLDYKPLPADFKALSLDEGRFESFDPKPSRIFGMGLVYSKHIIETAASFDPKIPPPIFIKELSSLNQNSMYVSLPNSSALLDAVETFEPTLKGNAKLEDIKLKPLLDYEVELAFVLLEDIEKSKLNDQKFAPKLGFFIANDLSARSIAVLGEGQDNKAEYWGVSKSFKGFLPVSKKIWIPKEHHPNGIPNILLETYVNGQLRQSEHTINMIYTPKEMLNFIQKKYPNYHLKKGDLIITGTPGGVAISTPKSIARLFDLLNINRFTKLRLLMKKNDSRFLKIGDEVLVKGVGLGEVKTLID